MPSLYANVVSANAVIQPNNNTSLYNPLGGNAIPVNGNINANNINVSNNVHVGGQISATGNIATAGYFIGDGSQLSNVAGSYGNSNVAAFLPTYSGNLAGNNITMTGAAVMTGNITTGGFYFGDGSQLTNLPAGNYGNSNVAAFLPTYSGNLGAGNIAVVNAITGASITVSGQISATGDISTAGNLRTLGAQGNIVGANYVSGNFFVGDGSLLTNVASSLSGNLAGNILGNGFGISNVVSLTGGNISATGNITGSYILGNGSQLTGLPTGYSNADVNSHLAAFGSNVISTTGNITAGYFVGNASLLSNLTGANVTGTVALATQANVANTANAVAGANVSGQVANALVAGTVYTNAQPNITSLGTLTSVSVTGDTTAGNILTSGTVSATGNITGNYILGNGSQLTGLGATYSNANVTTLLAAFGSNTISTTGTVTAGNVTGSNIITGGLISATGNITGNYILGNGSQLTGITGGVTSAAGNNLNFQYNNSGNFGGVPNTFFYSGNGVIEIASAKFEAGAGPSSQITVPGTAGYVSVTGNVIAGNVNAGVITATGNITGNYFIGNGSQLANIAAGGSANTLQFNNSGVFGGIPDSFHYTANGITEISKIKFSSTASGGGSGELFVPGTAGYVSVTGNVIAGNVNTAGVISATGNITGNYFLGNGSQLTGISAPAGNNLNFQYNNSNVFGGVPNTAFYTGNGVIEIASAKFEAGAGPSSQITVPGTAGYVSVTGNVIAGNVFTAGTVSATGNITGNYILGNGSQLTGITANATSGGSNTQIQFNDGGAFAGNALMTFDKTTGNIILGNVAINGQRILNGNVDPSSVTSVGVNPWQLRIGNGFNGTYTTANAVFGQTSGNAATGVGARLQQSDVYNLSNTTGRLLGVSLQNYVNITGNISNNTSRFQGLSSVVAVGGGASGNTMLTTIAGAVQAITGGVTVGNVNANLGIGNTTISTVVATTTTIQVGAGSNANTAFGNWNLMQYTASTGNIGNIVGFAIQGSGTPANANIVQTSNAVSFYHAASISANTIGGFNNGNIIRMSTNYHAFRNDDDLARSRLGMLERFHELNANTATATGTVDIDKNSGQVQTIYPTGNVTIGTFTNFVTRVTKPDSTFVNAADTVTLVINQGSTPYTVTMPTGNTQIRYAAGTSTVASTANTTVMISITGTYNYTTAANQYQITISPEFS